MTNVELVVKKLAMIDEHLRRLRQRRPADVEALRRDLLLTWMSAASVAFQTRTDQGVRAQRKPMS